MNCDFINRENSGRLIIIFAGWSTDSRFYRHISHPGWDLLVVSGYSDLDFPLELLESYHTIALFAWSLGVFAASRVIPFHRLSLAVAINGTEAPVDDELGIPSAIFHATATNLNERNLTKFRRRMCGEHYTALQERFSETDTSALAAQLNFIAATQETQSALPAASRWHRVYISDNDLIFPPAAQHKAWSTHPALPEIINLPQPHYVDLAPIIAATLPAKEGVRKRFHKALSTYDNQAVAQKAIAERLVAFPGGVPIQPLKVLEIGPGSGLFTRLMAERFMPRKIDYVDLYPLPRFNAAPAERYFTEDAEEWLSRQAATAPGSYDAVMSASALQWFANPDAFFRNVATLLRPGGFLLCSTFSPGNLKEMQAVNPYGLVYRKPEELESLLSKYFLFAKLEEEQLIVGFDSPAATLRHLRETGVSGGISTGRSPRRLLQSAPLLLTYRPLYLYAVTTTIPPINTP